MSARARKFPCPVDVYKRQECGVDLTAALDGLLVELIGAAPFEVEGGLEAVIDVEQEVDGADSFGVGGDADAVAVCFKVEHGGPCGKDSPINGVGESLLWRCLLYTSGLGLSRDRQTEHCNRECGE